MNAPDLGAPGLRLQGRDLNPRLRAESAVTGFVGIAERGPMNVPQPVYSWDQFLQIFGDVIDYGYLADAVFGFFLNGGEKCWVVRVGDLQDRSSENSPGLCPTVDLLLPASDTPLEDHDRNPTMRFRAINEGSWGNRISYSVLEESPRDMQLTDLRQGAQGSDSVFAVESALDFFPGQVVRVAHASNPFNQEEYTVDDVDIVGAAITIAGGNPIANEFPIGSPIFGHGFRVVARCGEQEEVFDDLSMNPLHRRYFARVINGEPDATEYLTRLQRGNSILLRVEHLLSSDGLSRGRPVAAEPTERSLSGGGDGFTQAHGTLRNERNRRSLRVVVTSRKGSKGNGLQVAVEPFTSRIALPIPLPTETGENDRFSSADAQWFRVGDEVRLDHLFEPETTEMPLPRVVDVEPDGFVLLDKGFEHPYPIGSTASVADRFDLSVFAASEDELIERFRNLRMQPEPDDGFVKRELELGSALICADPVDFSMIPQGEVTLDGGLDPGEIDPRFYTGYESDGSYFVPLGSDPDRRLGLATLERVDEVSLVAVPDLSRGERWKKEEGVILEEVSFWEGRYSWEDSYGDAQKQILLHCAKMGERMAVLDLMPEASLEDAAAWPSGFSDPRLAKFGTLYYPWVLRVLDGTERWVPPCGAIAGAFAASDRLHGVGKAPANLPLLGIAATRLEIDRAEQDGLNPLGVNCIRKLDAGQVNLMGSRTLAPRLNARYVNARRVLLTIVKALSKRMLWTLFEPNGPELWKQIEATLSGFMTSLVSKGMTAGKRPGEAFFVKCNAETNPTASIEAGQVIAEIGVALTAPAEFVLITARRTPESLNIVEEDT